MDNCLRMEIYLAISRTAADMRTEQSEREISAVSGLLSFFLSPPFRQSVFFFSFFELYHREIQFLWSSANTALSTGNVQDRTGQSCCLFCCRELSFVSVFIMLLISVSMFLNLHPPKPAWQRESNAAETLLLCDQITGQSCRRQGLGPRSSLWKNASEEWLCASLEAMAARFNPEDAVLGRGRDL